MRGTAARSTAAQLFLSRVLGSAEARAASGGPASSSSAQAGRSSAALRVAAAGLRAAVALATAYVGYDLASDAVFYALCKRRACPAAARRANSSGGRHGAPAALLTPLPAPATRSEAQALIEHNETLRAALGEPLCFGPWWDASVTRARGGGIATAQFVLRGPSSSADLRLGVVRSRAAAAHWASGSDAAHALAAPSDWRPLLAEVTLPGRGAHARLDLLQPATAADAGKQR